MKNVNPNLLWEERLHFLLRNAQEGFKGGLVLGGTQRVDSDDGDGVDGGDGNDDDVNDGDNGGYGDGQWLVMMVHYQVFDQLGAMAPHSLHSLQLKNCSQPIIMTNNDQ